MIKKDSRSGGETGDMHRAQGTMKIIEPTLSDDQVLSLVEISGDWRQYMLERGLADRLERAQIKVDAYSEPHLKELRAYPESSDDIDMEARLGRIRALKEASDAEHLAREPGAPSAIAAQTWIHHTFPGMRCTFFVERIFKPPLPSYKARFSTGSESERLEGMTKTRLLLVATENDTNYNEFLARIMNTLTVAASRVKSKSRLPVDIVSSRGMTGQVEWTFTTYVEFSPIRNRKMARYAYLQKRGPKSPQESRNPDYHREILSSITDEELREGILQDVLSLINQRTEFNFVTSMALYEMGFRPAEQKEIKK